MRTRHVGLLAFAVTLPASAIAQQQTAKLVASDGSAEDWFGVAVGVDGNRAVIGSYYHDHLGLESGAAYLFDVGTGQQLFELLASDGAPGDAFGLSVAVDTGRVIVGSYQDDEKGSGSGSAYVFDSATGQQLMKWTASDGAPNDIFGVSVSISGTRALVGASGDDGYAGSAYVFDVATGQQLFKLTTSERAPMDQWGKDVAIGGNYGMLMSATKGAVFVFDVTTSQELFKVDATTLGGSVRSIAVDGNRALIGVSNGTARLIDLATGQPVLTMHASDGGAGFGDRVALRNGLALIGASTDDDDGLYSGSAYVFDATTGQQLAKLKPNDGAPAKDFGVALAIEGDRALCGAYGDSAKGPLTGAAYLFDIDAPPSLQTYGSGCAGSGGVVPKLAVTGNPTVGGQVQVAITDGVGSSTALLFLGTQQAAIPMGFGCSLNVFPVLPLIVGPFPLFPFGALGPGGGSITFPGTIPGSVTPPLTLTMQAFVTDSGVVGGFSNTNGVEMNIQ